MPSGATQPVTTPPVGTPSAATQAAATHATATTDPAATQTVGREARGHEMEDLAAPVLADPVSATGHASPPAGRPPASAGSPAAAPAPGSPSPALVPAVPVRDAVTFESVPAAAAVEVDVSIALAESIVPAFEAREHGEREPDRRRHEDEPAIVAPGAASVASRERTGQGHATTEPPAAGARPEALVRQLVPELAALGREGRHELVLRLDPPELGAVRIEAWLDGRELTLRIRAEDAGARDLLEQGLPRLREALAQEGLTAQRVSVQLGLAADPRHAGTGARPSRPAVIAPEPAAPGPSLDHRMRIRAVSGAAIDLWI
jgi:flagellar hook-length control protein FliK